MNIASFCFVRNFSFRLFHVIVDIEAFHLSDCQLFKDRNFNRQLSFQ